MEEYVNVTSGETKPLDSVELDIYTFILEEYY